MRLHRVQRHGYTAGYRTPDGRFQIENALGGHTGGAATSWTVIAFSEVDGMRLALAGMDRPFPTLRSARELLEGSIYAPLSGWLAVPDDQVCAQAGQGLYASVEAR